MSDTPPNAHTADVLESIDRARADLIALLRSKDANVLAQRPPSGEWSVIENVRHLLFAEQLHLGKHVPGGIEWSHVGLTTWPKNDYADVGKEPTDELENVVEVWDAVHQTTREALMGGKAPVRKALERNLRHLGRHIETIEGLLEDSGG